MHFDLDRFTKAQDHGGAFGVALEELRAGRKRSHWIWFVFPQLRGLGHSPMAERYGLDGAAEAVAYLRNPVLRSRLREATLAVHGHLANHGASLPHLMASQLDALKLVSSMTLFEQAARTAQATDLSPEVSELATVAGEILAIAEEQGYPRCRLTLDALG